MNQQATQTRTDNEADQTLPEWDLSHLYADRNGPEIKADLDWALERSQAFRATYEGRLADLTGAGLGKAIAEYEEIGERLGKVMSYAQLLFASDVSNPEYGRFFQTLAERVTVIETETLFFALELNRIGDDVLAGQLKDPAAARYEPWIRDVRVFRPHQLSDEVEKLLLEKSVTGRAAWNRLFDETLAALRFPIGDAELPISDYPEHADRYRRRQTEGCRQGAGIGVERQFAPVHP